MEFQEENEGEGFLNLDVNSLSFTHQIKALVANIIGHHGATKPKQRSEEYRRMKIYELLNIITFAAKLTKNNEESAACPIAVETIRNYDLKAKNYELPPYHVGETRSNTLHVQFVNAVGKAYEKYGTHAESEVERYKLGQYMESTSWKDTLEPLLAEITRYCIKFWHLHPHYNRKAATEAALEYLEENFKKKGDTKRIIDSLLEKAKLEGITQDVLALETEKVTYDGEEKTVFKENDSAQTLIAQFLHMKKFKWDKKSTLDMIQALHQYMDQASNIEKHKFRQFAGMVPKRTATYLEKVNKVERAKEAEERKRVAMQEKAAKQAEAKRQKLEEKQKMIQEMEASQKEQEEEEDFNTEGGNTHEKEKQTETINLLKDDKDEFSEYRLPSISHVIEEKKGGRVRRVGSKLEINANVGIRKRLVKIHIKEGTLDVVYTKPGGRWRSEMTLRLGACMAALNAFALEEPALVNHYVSTARRECGETYAVSKKAARILLAINMHMSATKEEEMAKLTVHPCVTEDVLVQDYHNTLELWCTGLYSTCLQHLDCLYDLCFSEDSPKETFCDFVGSKFMVDQEWGTHVTQILDLVYFVQQYFDFNKVQDGQTIPIDPFETVSEVFEKDAKKAA